MNKCVARLAVGLILVLVIPLGSAVASGSKNTQCSSLPEKQIVDAILNQQYGRARELTDALNLAEAIIPSTTFYHGLATWHGGYQIGEIKLKKAGISALRKSIKEMQVSFASGTRKSSLALGLSKGHTARALLENEQYFSGYELGMQARQHIDEYRNLSSETAIGFDDTGLLLGLYEVYTHDLIEQNQWLARKIVSRGNREKGIRLIESAINGSSIFATEAMRALLAEVSWRTPDTCKYADAVDRIGQQFSENNDLAVLRQGLLLKCGYLNRAQRAHDSYASQEIVSAGMREQMEKARFRILADRGDIDSLLELSTSDHLEPYRLLAFANALDIAGERPRAQDIYQQLYSMNDIPLVVKSVAKVRIRFPYNRPTKIDVPQFELRISDSDHC